MFLYIKNQLIFAHNSPFSRPSVDFFTILFKEGLI